MGKGLVEISSPQGMAADTTSAAIILTSSHLGMALSTTQVATGSILGSGVGARSATVRWALAGRMAVAWVVTLPAAGVMGALCWFVADGIGGALGVTVVLGALLLTAGGLFYRSRRTQITPANVTADWQGGLAPAETPEHEPVTKIAA